MQLPHLDQLGIKFQAFLLVDQEFLNILALIALKLDHLAHLRIADNGAIAGCGVPISKDSVRKDYESFKDCLPNFFLMTLRIFF